MRLAVIALVTAALFYVGGPKAGAVVGGLVLERQLQRGLVASECADKALEPTAANLGRVRAATLCLINAERAAVGAPAIVSAPLLVESATAKSTDMVRLKYFGHAGPDVQAQMRAVGYQRAAAHEGRPVVGGAEILAWAGQELAASPRQIVYQWKHSPSHRKAMLHASLTEAGVGVALGAPAPDKRGGATYTTHFAGR